MISVKTILIIVTLIGIPLLIIADSVLIKWIRVKVSKDSISVRRLFRLKKTYSLSKDLNSWKRVQGYSRFGGNGYLLILRFNNHDSYQIDSSYGLRQYEEIYRELNMKYKELKDNE